MSTTVGVIQICKASEPVYIDRGRHSTILGKITALSASVVKLRPRRVAHPPALAQLLGRAMHCVVHQRVAARC